MRQLPRECSAQHAVDHDINGEAEPFAGIVLGQLIQFILAAVSMNEVGSAAGVMEASQQLSASLGVAVLGTIFFALFKHHPATDALRVTSWACLLPLAAAFTFVFLLPKHAREEERQRH
jgi:hypothetical protein